MSIVYCVLFTSADNESIKIKKEKRVKVNEDSKEIEIVWLHFVSPFKLPEEKVLVLVLNRNHEIKKQGKFKSLRIVEKKIGSQTQNSTNDDINSNYSRPQQQGLYMNFGRWAIWCEVANSVKNDQNQFQRTAPPWRSIIWLIFLRLERLWGLHH